MALCLTPTITNQTQLSILHIGTGTPFGIKMSYIKFPNMWWKRPLCLVWFHITSCNHNCQGYRGLTILWKSHYWSKTVGVRKGKILYWFVSLLYGNCYSLTKTHIKLVPFHDVLVFIPMKNRNHSSLKKGPKIMIGVTFNIWLRQILLLNEFQQVIFLYCSDWLRP